MALCFKLNSCEGEFIIWIRHDIFGTARVARLPPRFTGEHLSSVSAGRKCECDLQALCTSGEKHCESFTQTSGFYFTFSLFFPHLSMWRSKHSNTKTQTVEVSIRPSSQDWWLPNRTLLETHQSLTRCCLWRRSRPRDSKAHHSFWFRFETQKEK